MEPPGCILNACMCHRFMKQKTYVTPTARTMLVCDMFPAFQEG